MSLESLLSTLTDRRAAFEMERRSEARRRAPEFTVFDFIRPGELILSEILASLLDPAGTHGQGSLFLAEFLNTLQLDWSTVDLDGARVQVEAPTFERRRVDIVIRFGDAVLGIENKPFAADQPNQVTDYLAWLDLAVPGGRRCLVYLAHAEGVLPAEGSISAKHRQSRHAEDQFRPLSYPGLVPWLERARNRCEAASVTAFIDALIQFIRREFMGIRDMTERQQLVRIVRQSPEALRSALEILSAATEIQTDIMNSLEGQVRQRLPQGYDLSGFYVSPERWTNISITMPGILGLSFSVSFEGYGYTRLIYGVKGEEGAGVSADKSTASLMDAEYGSGKVSLAWPWYRFASLNERIFPVEGNWRVSELPWVKAADGTFAGTVVAAVQAVRATLADTAV
ncbi:PD-(D/E)XK nuclease family protein [Methylobacterium sp. E-016]|uniref:PDDEXK-like family protein n=1 Tax=Methylobacterium sp. E-016 TaxID=2836556 RepID=UPI001FB8B606|nr:PD-(D/E)XK nuclease family protein [Methylobacterium sp. E-016]MCJ2077653.1 PD-(D/E)XK nuclease family protein [Methylobacterium sp. E-016]